MPRVPLALVRELSTKVDAAAPLGRSWRLRELAYPTDASAVCLCLQTFTGGDWKTAAAFDPTGNNLLEVGGGGDMQRAVYDTDGDGVVDNAEALEGHPASYFALAGHVHPASPPVLPSYTTATRPAADAAAAGCLIRVRDANQSEKVQACIQQSGGTWEWLTIGIASR